MPQTSASSRFNKRPSTHYDEDCDDMEEPDELFFVLQELMFPEGESDDDDLLNEKPKPRKMLQPPPHVAIDPVALFHWYKKNAWDVHPVPGEDRHMKLRWNVRAKTIGGCHPCI